MDDEGDGTRLGEPLSCLTVSAVPGLGLAYVACHQIEAGQLLLREEPTLVATAIEDVEADLAAAFEEGAEDGEVELDDCLALHAFARAEQWRRNSLLVECCGAEVCDKGHAIVASAIRTAQWCYERDPECAALPITTLERALCAFSLNSFGDLADGITGGAASLYVRATKFTHRCLRPSVTFYTHGEALCFRTTQAVATGEVLTINYLGDAAHCGTPRRRQLLYKSKAFLCCCEDCVAKPDLNRRLPCPRCHAPSRNPATGLLPSVPRPGTGGLVTRWPLVPRERLAHGAVTSIDAGGSPKPMLETEAVETEAVQRETRAQGRGGNPPPPPPVALPVPVPKAASPVALADASTTSENALPDMHVDGVWRCAHCHGEWSDNAINVHWFARRHASPSSRSSRHCKCTCSPRGTCTCTCSPQGTCTCACSPQSPQGTAHVHVALKALLCLFICLAAASVSACLGTSPTTPLSSRHLPAD